MKYIVEITRTSYQTKTFEVEAKSSKQAEELALEEAASTSFDSEDGADYEVEDIYKS